MGRAVWAWNPGNVGAIAYPPPPFRPHLHYDTFRGRSVASWGPWDLGIVIDTEGRQECEVAPSTSPLYTACPIVPGRSQDMRSMEEGAGSLEGPVLGELLL